MNSEAEPMSEHQKFVRGARRKLEEAAIKYARMKTLGRRLEDVSDVRVGHADQKTCIDLYATQLCEAAVDLLAELTNAPLPESP